MCPLVWSDASSSRVIVVLLNSYGLESGLENRILGASDLKVLSDKKGDWVSFLKSICKSAVQSRKCYFLQRRIALC